MSPSLIGNVTGSFADGLTAPSNTSAAATPVCSPARKKASAALTLAPQSATNAPGASATTASGGAAGSAAARGRRARARRVRRRLGRQRERGARLLPGGRADGRRGGRRVAGGGEPVGEAARDVADQRGRHGGAVRGRHADVQVWRGAGGGLARAPRPARRLPLWARPLVHDLRLQLALAASRAPLRGRPLLLAQAHRPRHRHRAARQRACRHDARRVAVCRLHGARAQRGQRQRLGGGTAVRGVPARGWRATARAAGLPQDQAARAGRGHRRHALALDARPGRLGARGRRARRRRLGADQWPLRRGRRRVVT
mmetsp:Transcript_55972/g.147018  ORF Transcript_55972/g.147018 Transcript_55972/m.147018 type:complete len:313 (+) Transcript_55972:896-1834(+)